MPPARCPADRDPGAEPPHLRAHDPAHRRPGRRARPGRLAGALPASRRRLSGKRHSLPGDDGRCSPRRHATAPNASPATGPPSRSHSAAPGSRHGTCPSSSPAPPTSGSWSTAAPNAATPSASGPVTAPPSRSCPSCGWPGCTPPSAGQTPPRAGTAGSSPPAAAPGSTRPDPASTPAPGCSRSRTRSSASLTRTAPPARSAQACRHLQASYFADLRALGLLACSTWPATRNLSPCERHRGSHRPARRLAPAAGGRTAGELPRVDRPHGPSAAGRSRQRRPSAHRRPHPRRHPRRGPLADKAAPPAKHPGTQAGPTGPAGLPCRPPRAPRACKPPTIPSCGNSPARSASRGAAAAPSSTLPGGDRRTSPRSSPRTGTPATSCRSPTSAPYSSAGRQRSGWSRWSPADHSPKPRTSWESHPGTAPGPGRAAGLRRGKHVHSGARKQPDPLGFEDGLEALARELNDPARHWSTTSHAARHWRPGASTRTPGQSRCQPAAHLPPPGARSRGPQTPARLRLRLGPRHLRRAPLRPATYRGRPASGCPGRLATIPGTPSGGTC